MIMCKMTDRRVQGHYVSIANVCFVGASVAALLAAPLAEARPKVNGSEISWPDDGWYQVQSASTYASICQGGASCTVDDGTYIVINHTTGERFTDITVNGESEIEEPPIQSTF